MHLKFCRCGKTIPLSQSTCEQCEESQKERHKSYDKYVRDKDSKAFYNSPEWRRVRKQALIRDNYLCVECLKERKITPAYIVDHISEIKDGGDKLNINNLQCLCQMHHNQKTARVKKERQLNSYIE